MRGRVVTETRNTVVFIKSLTIDCIRVEKKIDNISMELSKVVSKI